MLVLILCKATFYVGLQIVIQIMFLNMILKQMFNQGS